MSYIKQRDRFRCGPVTIINAIQWAGKDLSYKKAIKRISTSCKCESPHGTTFRPFLTTLRKEGKKLFKVTTVLEPTLREIEDFLCEGNALAWNFQHAGGRHYALLTGVAASGATFDVVNFGQEDPIITKLKRDEIKQIIRQRDCFHRVWVISRK